MQKENIQFELYPLGTKFWVMENNRPTQVEITRLSIDYAKNNAGETVIDINYTLFRSAAGSFYCYSRLLDPLYETREKLIASLF